MIFKKKLSITLLSTIMLALVTIPSIVSCSNTTKTNQPSNNIPNDDNINQQPETLIPPPSVITGNINYHPSSLIASKINESDLKYIQSYYINTKSIMVKALNNIGHRIEDDNYGIYNTYLFNVDVSLENDELSITSSYRYKTSQERFVDNEYDVKVNDIFTATNKYILTPRVIDSYYGIQYLYRLNGNKIRFDSTFTLTEYGLIDSIDSMYKSAKVYANEMALPSNLPIDVIDDNNNIISIVNDSQFGNICKVYQLNDQSIINDGKCIIPNSFAYNGVDYKASSSFNDEYFTDNFIFIVKELYLSKNFNSIKLSLDWKNLDFIIGETITNPNVTITSMQYTYQWFIYNKHVYTYIKVNW